MGQRNTWGDVGRLESTIHFKPLLSILLEIHRPLCILGEKSFHLSFFAMNDSELNKRTNRRRKLVRLCPVI